MTERIRLALQAHANDPAGAAASLRALIAEDSAQFLRALTLIRGEWDNPEVQFLFALLAEGTGVTDQLCDPRLLDKASAIDMAQRIAGVAPDLDSKLARLLPIRGSNDGDPAKLEQAERILELLEVISVSGRLTSMLAHLTNHPNVRLRAKVTLLIARWSPNLRAAEKMLDEKDGRVRANAVESLWGDKGKRTLALLWRATKDIDNRVVGNALFGLYDLQDPEAIPHIFELATHEKPLFRATAAWTMGQTKDPQFLPALEKLTHDLYASVRKSALKGMRQMPGCAEQTVAVAASSILQSQ